MKKRNQTTRKKKKQIMLNLFRPPSRTYIAGFPIARGAFYNELWDWRTLETIKI